VLAGADFGSTALQDDARLSPLDFYTTSTREYNSSYEYHQLARLPRASLASPRRLFALSFSLALQLVLFHQFRLVQQPEQYYSNLTAVGLRARAQDEGHSALV
jgi:hypothetical protein